MTNWQPYISVLAGTVGVRDEDAEYPMGTFRPCETDDEACLLSEAMTRAGFVGDAFDFDTPASANNHQNEEGA